jgi:hypothetical protein
MTARLAVLYLLLTTSAFANIITTENARPGTRAWRFARSASKDIGGYASATSAAPGETIRMFVSTTDPTFTLQIFRMGWYGGDGARSMQGPIELAGRNQPVPSPDPVTGLIRCNWEESYRVTIPADWLSGVYLAKITGKPSGNENYIMFVVRDERAAAILFQSAVTTFQAYNNWGGKSLYPFNSTGPQAQKVSFDRPYEATTGGFLYQYEYNMVRWLEREGYDVTYATNIDTAARPWVLTRVKAFLSTGHDEYWSWEMRANVEAARDHGVDLAFFSANSCYWQIRFEDDYRTIVGYKESALSADPFAHDGDPTNDHLVTTLWRNVPVMRPEEELIGVMTEGWEIDDDVVVQNASHWVFANTGLKPGHRLRGLLGYEVDSVHGIRSPRDLVVLAHSPFTNEDGISGYSDMTIYTAPSGAIVFAAGTIQWSWGLDDFNAEARGERRSNAAQQITRNVLDRMITPKVPKRRAVR